MMILNSIEKNYFDIFPFRESFSLPKPNQIPLQIFLHIEDIFHHAQLLKIKESNIYQKRESPPFYKSP